MGAVKNIIMNVEDILNNAVRAERNGLFEETCQAFRYAIEDLELLDETQEEILEFIEDTIGEKMDIYHILQEINFPY